MADYKDLLGPDGTENNMGGTQQFFFFTPHEDILTFGEPAASPSDADDKYVIKVAHIMKSGKKFLTVYTTIDTSELEQALNGEIDGRSFKPTFKFFYPGSKKESIAFVNRVKNGKFVFIVPLSDGTMIQIGAKQWCAYVSPNFKTGTTSGRGKGTEFEVMAYQPDIMIYEAAVPTTPAA
ncbi:hypothetical protein [Spirosoma fluminis]